MGLPSSTKHQNDHNLPDVLRGTVFAAIPQRDHVVLDFTTHAGPHLELHVPRFLYDALCARLGNAYKAGCWVAARCGEVDTLSRQAIERYVNMSKQLRKSCCACATPIPRSPPCSPAVASADLH